MTIMRNHQIVVEKNTLALQQLYNLLSENNNNDRVKTKVVPVTTEYKKWKPKTTQPPATTTAAMMGFGAYPYNNPSPPIGSSKFFEEEEYAYTPAEKPVTSSTGDGQPFSYYSHENGPTFDCC